MWNPPASRTKIGCRGGVIGIGGLPVEHNKKINPTPVKKQTRTCALWGVCQIGLSKCTQITGVEGVLCRTIYILGRATFYGTITIVNRGRKRGQIDGGELMHPPQSRH